MPCVGQRFAYLCLSAAAIFAISQVAERLPPARLPASFSGYAARLLFILPRQPLIFLSPFTIRHHFSAASAELRRRRRQRHCLPAFRQQQRCRRCFSLVFSPPPAALHLSFMPLSTD
jgi:hypothetical protein